MRSTSGDQGRLAVYGAQRTADGALTVAVINKSAAALTSTLSLAGAMPAGPAKGYRWAAPGGGIAAIADQAVGAGGLEATYPGRSMTLLVIPTQAAPAPAPAPSPSPGSSLAVLGTLTPADDLPDAGWLAGARQHPANRPARPAVGPCRPQGTPHADPPPARRTGRGGGESHPSRQGKPTHAHGGRRELPRARIAQDPGDRSPERRGNWGAAPRTASDGTCHGARDRRGRAASDQHCDDSRPRDAHALTGGSPRPSAQPRRQAHAGKRKHRREQVEVTILV